MKPHAGPGLLGEERGWVPVAIEDDSESAWAEYDACCEALEARLARRKPRTQSGRHAAARVRDGQLARELAQPVAVRPRDAAMPVQASAPRRPAGVDDLMRLARVNDRVCPTLQAWRLLYQTLPVDPSHGERAPLPIDRLHWVETPDLLKRLRLREQLEWAQARGPLDGALHFLEQLRESQWHHHGPTEWPQLPEINPD